MNQKYWKKRAYFKKLFSRHSHPENHYKSERLKNTELLKRDIIGRSKIYEFPNCWADFINTSEKMRILMQEWKIAGYAGDADDYLWIEFYNIRNYFFSLQSQFVIDIQQRRMILIEKVTKIRRVLDESSNIDYQEIRINLLDIQEEWKNIPWIGKFSRMNHSCFEMRNRFKLALDDVYSFLKSSKNNHFESKYKKSKYKNNEHKELLEPMSIDKAIKNFNLKQGYTKNDIKSAYRILIKEHHPDKGGNVKIAQQINVAKDMLCKQHK